MEEVTWLNQIERFYEIYGYPALFVSSALESSPFGWIIPGGHFLAGAGFFAYGPTLSLGKVLIIGTAGTWSTLLGAYFLGHKTGLYLVKKLKQEKNAKRAKVLLERHGGAILSTSLMANATRFWVSYFAGVQNYNLIKFALYSLIASLTWVSLWTSIGFLAGSERIALEQSLVRLGILSIIPLVIAAATIYWTTKRELKEFTEDEPLDEPEV